MTGQYCSNEPLLQQTLATGELQNRHRPVDHKNENKALLRLADTLVAEPENILSQLADTILGASLAQSAGISVLEEVNGEEQFRWTTVVGAFAQHSGGTMRRLESPCGIVIETEEVQLFRQPARFFAPLAAVEPPINEALLAPFDTDGRPAGTIWALTHDEQLRFDAEDARVLRNLSHFASGCFRLVAAHEVQRSARREAEQRLSEVEALRNRQQVLLRELNHRAGNLLTIVSAIASQTVGRGRSVADFQQRIAALSRAQNLITGPAAGASVEEVVGAELEPYLGEHGERITIQGPHAVVEDANVQALSLAVHELATNALKYGALKAPAGCLEIRWDILRAEGGARAVLEWRESGVEISDEAIDRRGFGRELIERSLGHALNAEVDYRLQRNGVTCTIVLPIEGGR